MAKSFRGGATPICAMDSTRFSVRKRAFEGRPKARRSPAEGIELILGGRISKLPGPVNADFVVRKGSFDFNQTTGVQLLYLRDISHRNCRCLSDFGSDVHHLSFGQI
jgi:hypothetical protein